MTSSQPHRVFLLALCALAAGSAAHAQEGLSRNTKQVGFISLPGLNSTQGLWANKAGGRQYCLQTRGSTGLGVIHMTDTSNPTLASNVPGNFRKVAAYQSFAYATTDFGPTAIVDLRARATINARGNASVSLPIPANFSFGIVYAQGLVQDAGAPNTGGFAFSRAGKIVIY